MAATEPTPPRAESLRAFLAQCRLALVDQASLGFEGLMQDPGPASVLLRPQDDPLHKAANADADLAPAPDARRPSSLTAVREELGECTRCPLHETRTSIVFGCGDAQASLMFVGEGPGRDEDLEGEPFVGEAGRLLDRMLAAMGTSRQHIYIANVIKCRPPKNRYPERNEIAQCLPFVQKQVATIAPKVVVALGRCAAESLLGRPVRITKERGAWQELVVAGHTCQLMLTLHPAYLLRNPADKGLVWQDLQAVMQALDMPRPRAASAGTSSTRG